MTFVPSRRHLPRHHPTAVVCVLQLGEALELSLSKERVRQAETDAYIVDRVCAVLHALKACVERDQTRDRAPVSAGSADESRVVM